MDPKDQYFSPYEGMGNNPVIGIDPDGGGFWSWITGKGWDQGGFKDGSGSTSKPIEVDEVVITAPRQPKEETSQGNNTFQGSMFNVAPTGYPQIKKEGTFEDANVYSSSDLPKGSAVTLPGIGIFVRPEDVNDDALKKHEYGHMLQAKLYGKVYFYTNIATVSVLSTGPHQQNWSENEANTLSYLKFGLFGRQTNGRMTEYPINSNYMRGVILSGSVHKLY